jgi:oligopeptide transport system ATP-binding protein
VRGPTEAARTRAPGIAGGDGGAPLLEVRDLHTHFETRGGTVHAVNGVSFRLGAGEALALVGESGSGKSVSALSVLGLVPPPGRVVAGEILLSGRDLRKESQSEIRRIRGREIAMVFQDPMTSLNPVMPVGRQIEEVLSRHLGMDRPQARAECERLLTRVGIPDAGRRSRDAPHTFSGGQRQRIMIAMALACRPQLLIADEPTTALDVTVQAQIVELVQELQDELGMAVLWITHDLALVAGIVDRVAVLYSGTVVEEAPVAELFRNPRHPYTRGLMGALPGLDFRGATDAPTGHEGEGLRPRLTPVEGRPPVLTRPPTFCPFAPRCDFTSERCHEERPPLETVAYKGDTADVSGERADRPSSDLHRAACWNEEGLP